MDRNTVVDARGLACPQPVLLTLTAMKSNANRLTVLVDAEVSRENVSRAARSRHWQVESIEFNDPDYRLQLVKDTA